VEVKRRRETVLAAIVVLLGVVAYTAYERLAPRPQPSTAAGGSSNGQGQASRRGNRAAPAGPHVAEAPQVHLDALSAKQPMPDSSGRDLFHFRVKPPPPAAVPPPPAVGPQPAPPPPGPPPVPPITLKFIGVVDMPSPGTRVAVLSDGRGAPVYGHEGDTVLGQYRIVRIGAESVEVSYLDGRGRQTIRLSGS